MANPLLSGTIIGSLFLMGTVKVQAQTPPVTLIFEADTIDRLGTGNKAKLVPDGKKDSVFSVYFAPGTGEHAITGLKLQQGNNLWDTDPASGGWTLGVAQNALNLLGDLVNQPDSSVAFTVPDGGSFTLFASASPLSHTLDYTVTMTYADGTTAQINTLNDLGIFAVFEGETTDRLATGNKGIAKTSDGKNDGAFTIYFPTGLGSHTVTGLSLVGANNTHWDTDQTTSAWDLGVSPTLTDPFVNAADDSISMSVADGGKFVVFAPDDNQDHYVNAATVYTLSLTFEDGLTPAVTPKPKGDLNGDNRVNIQDATLALQIAVGSLTPTFQQSIVGDVNGDGKINLQDTTAILIKAIS